MIDLVRATLARAFLLYRPLPRGLREAGIPLMIAGLAFTAAMSALVLYSGWKFRSLPSTSMDDLQVFVYSAMFTSGSDLFIGFMVPWVGLCAVVWRRHGSTPEAWGSFRTILKNLTPNNWSSFFMAMLFLVTAECALFILLSDTNTTGSWFEVPYTEDSGEFMRAQYRRWALGLLGIVRRYLPYLVALYLFFADRRIGLSPSVLHRSLPAIGATLVLAFLVGSVGSALWNAYWENVTPVFAIAFANSPIPGLINLSVIVFFGAWMVPLIALVLFGPLDALEARGKMAGDPSPQPADPSGASVGWSETPGRNVP